MKTKTNRTIDPNHQKKKKLKNTKFKYKQKVYLKLLNCHCNQSLHLKQTKNNKKIELFHSINQSNHKQKQLYIIKYNSKEKLINTYYQTNQELEHAY